MSIPGVELCEAEARARLQSAAATETAHRRDAERVARQQGAREASDAIAAKRRLLEDAKSDLVAWLRYGESIVVKLDACIDETFDFADELREAREK